MYRERDDTAKWSVENVEIDKFLPVRAHCPTTYWIRKSLSLQYIKIVLIKTKTSQKDRFSTSILWLRERLYLATKHKKDN